MSASNISEPKVAVVAVEQASPEENEDKQFANTPNRWIRSPYVPILGLVAVAAIVFGIVFGTGQHLKSTDSATSVGTTTNPPSTSTNDNSTIDDTNVTLGDDEDLASADYGLQLWQLDKSFDPRQDFYEYTTGGWVAANPIPEGYSRWTMFAELDLLTQERLRSLLEAVKDEGDAMTSEESLVAMFYTAAIDEEEIEQAGLTPFGPVLEAIEEIVVAFEQDSAGETFARLLGELSFKYLANPFFEISAQGDALNSSWTNAALSESGLGLPERDYYLEEALADTKGNYTLHVSKMLQLLRSDLDADTSMALAEAIVNLESTLAEAYLTQVQWRDSQALYNMFTFENLTASANNTFDFAAFFEGASGRSIEDLGDSLQVLTPIGVFRGASVLASVDSETLRAYLQWTNFNRAAEYLTKAVVQQDFDFYSSYLNGVTGMKPRWQRAMSYTDTYLGEPLGMLYVDEYFPAESKEQALRIVDAVLAAMRDRLLEVDWIQSNATRENALKKLDAFNVKIGYPDVWIDYSSLSFNESDVLLDMIFKAQVFGKTLAYARMSAPTDRDLWYMTPQTINAYYDPTLNEIVFPAAILQPPVFYPDGPDYLNFGGFGSVVGHEITHGFDDEGRKYDYLGELRDWWTPEDAAEYERRADVIKQQASEYLVYGEPVNGNLTAGESIADVGGVRLALRALKGQAGFDPNEVDESLGDLTALQLFFLSWATTWRTNITKENALLLLRVDYHPPAPFRADNPPSNMVDFYQAFNVQPGDAMYRDEQDRVDIW